MRETCLLLAEQAHTPVPWWLGLPLHELSAWIRAQNRITEARKKKPRRRRYGG